MEELLTIKLRTDESSWESAQVRRAGPDRYQLEQTPMWSNREDDRLFLGDEIRAELLPDGTHLFVGLAARSPLDHFSWAVPRSFVESVHYRRFAEAVEAAGGRWEGMTGGILFVHLPPNVAFNAEAELQGHLAAARFDAG